MIEDTINEGKTISGGGKDVTLAGRYNILWQLDKGGRKHAHMHRIRSQRRDTLVTSINRQILV